MRKRPWVLGINSSHNGSACLLRGDEIVVAIQEERLSRIKRQRLFGGLSSLAVRQCLETGGIGPSELDLVVLCAQEGNEGPDQDPRRNPDLRDLACPVLHAPHHFCHAISAFVMSGFSESTVLVVDGVGSPAVDMGPAERAIVDGPIEARWEIISAYRATGQMIAPLEKQLAPRRSPDPLRSTMPWFASLGTMYAAAAAQIFGAEADAGKVMGLAPYGRRRFPAESFFREEDERIVFTAGVRSQFDYPDPWPAHSELYADLACSVQLALEEALLSLARRLRARGGSANLCFAGGVALNSVANERLVRESGFDGVFIIPAAEDSGIAIGAAYHGLSQLTGQFASRPLRRDALGPVYTQSRIDAAIRRASSAVPVETTDLMGDVAGLLAAGRIVGWFDGGSEFGPRALGSRSILADPRDPEAKRVLNARVKHREAFRPFAPAVLHGRAGDWFDLRGEDDESPFMLRVLPVAAACRSRIPAVTHVDGTARLQTVNGNAHPRLAALIEAFEQRTGVPVLVNTSFNIAGEPIVETPEDALYCLLKTGLDYCILGNRLVGKSATIDNSTVLRLSRRIDDFRASHGQIGPEADDEAATGLLEAAEQALAGYRDEVARHLGTLPPDLAEAGAERHWRMRLGELLWARCRPLARQVLVRAWLTDRALAKLPGSNEERLILVLGLASAAFRQLAMPPVLGGLSEACLAMSHAPWAVLDRRLPRALAWQARRLDPRQSEAACALAQRAGGELERERDLERLFEAARELALLRGDALAVPTTAALAAKATEAFRQLLAIPGPVR